MDVVLGVAVAGPIARLALVGSGAQGTDVIDQSVVELDDCPIEKLTETVVGTNRLLADEHHRLVATRLCWTDDPKADQLRRALEDSGVLNVAVLSESQAVATLMRAAGRPGAALVMDDETATLSVPASATGDEDAPPTVLAQEPLAEIPDDPTFALARGAAMAAAPLAASSAGDATAMAPAVGLTGDETAIAPAAEFADPNAAEPQLAYSMAGDSELLPAEIDEYGAEYGDFDDAEAGPARLSRRSLLIGNAVIAFAVIGFASLAVAVAIAIRPTASQAPVVGHQNAAPGKFMPLLPTQQQAPVPPPPADQPNAGFQGGTVPAPAGGGSAPQQVAPPPVGGTPAVPAPVAPSAPALSPNPNPNLPIPIPIIVPFPGWQPNNPTAPPYTPPTAPTTTYPPTTTYTPPTTSYTPPTTTYTPPTTTYTPPTTTYSPPTTTYSPPPTTSYTPPTTSYAPPTTSYAPQTQTQTQQTLPPTHSQQPVTPQQPHGGAHHGF